MNKEIFLEAMFRGNIDVIFCSANDNNAKQAEDIAYLIKKKVDLMIISPNESAPVTPAVEMAYKSNIPIIISDRKIRSDKFTAYIGPDNYEIGALAGEFIVKYLKGKGKIVEIKGTEGASPTIERHEGFMSVVNKYKDIEVIYSESGIFLESIGEKKMEEALLLNPEIDLVFAHNDRMAKGAYKVVKAKGREKEITFVPVAGYAERTFVCAFFHRRVLHARLFIPAAVGVFAEALQFPLRGDFYFTPASTVPAFGDAELPGHRTAQPGAGKILAFCFLGLYNPSGQ